MAQTRSFAEYVKEKCYNGLFEAAEQFVEHNWQLLDLYTRHVHKIGAVEFVDATIQRVYVQDLPEMRVAFDVGLELELTVKEGDYHYDNYDQCYPWVRISCEGDLSDGLNSWQINRIQPYSKKNAPMNSLSDALVPFIPYTRLEEEAKAFLRDHYPEALRITPYGQPPVAIDPLVLADRLTFTILTQRIREDASVFGQIYFVETDTEMFDASKGETVQMRIPERTIVVDPQMYLLRNLGCANNTIVHECVHWVKHRKVFELEKLYNAEASSISCEVVGGAAAKIAKSATEQMEKQANQLTPRIQMPAEPFRAKAKEYIARFMRESGATHENEVMEQVIIALQTDYGVSKQAAKIRLVELGFDTAIGTFTYLDGHYVKPHGFRKGALKENQTFSISAQDAAIERFVNPELRKLTETGDYLWLCGWCQTASALSRSILTPSTRPKKWRITAKPNFRKSDKQPFSGLTREEGKLQMSKFESICDVMKSDSGPVIAGVGAITVLVGGYYLSKRGYKGEVKKGDITVSLTPTSPAPEVPEAEAIEPAAE